MPILRYRVLNCIVVLFMGSAATSVCRAQELESRESIEHEVHHHLSHSPARYGTPWRCAQPLGTSMQAIMKIQRAHGEAARMVLYRYDFLPDDHHLNGRGKRQLSKIARMLGRTDFPLLIEPSPADLPLDEVRRWYLIDELAKTAFAVPDDRVIIGHSPTHGLDGIDAESIHQRLLNRSLLGPSGGGSTQRVSGSQ